MTYSCYMAVCSASQKSYIGITSSGVINRWRGHCRSARRGSNLALHAAIRKYGESAFKVSEIARFKSRGQALDFEVSAIARFKTMLPNGYNMTIGGDGCADLCESAKLQKSKSAKSAHQRQDVKERHHAGIMSAMTSDVRMKIARAKTGLKMHPNAKAAILKVKKSETYRKIASEAASRVWSQDGYKQKWQQAKLAKHVAKAKKFPKREDGLIFTSTRAAARYMAQHGWEKAAANNIALACGGKYKSSCGYAWSWIDGDVARHADRFVSCP